MKKILEENKIILANIILIILLILSFTITTKNNSILKNNLRVISSVALITSITNWLILQVILERFSFLYNIEKLKEYMSTIKAFLINDIFGSKNFENLKKEYITNILNENDKKNINTYLNKIQFNSIVNFIHNTDINKIIVDNILTKLNDVENSIKDKLMEKLQSGLELKDSKEFIKNEILPIIETKLELSIVQSSKSHIREIIIKSFDWIILWGISISSALAFIFKFLEIL